MYSLFIDTHGKNVLIILFKDGKVLEKIDIATMNKHSVVTMPSIRQILENNNCEVTDLNEILVCNGPGSFTGSRIAVTIAKTMAYALDVPIKQIDALTIMAVNVANDNKVVALKDRNGAYVGKYDSNNMLLDDLVYISNSEYNDLCNTTNVVEEVDINYETVYSYLSKLESINVHEIKPIYVKGISALDDK